VTYYVDFESINSISAQRWYKIDIFCIRLFIKQDNLFVDQRLMINSSWLSQSCPDSILPMDNIELNLLVY
jgi:hypothetical protein